MEEPSWDIGDGYLRWCRGISLPKMLMALIRPEVIAYVSGCHIKLVKLGLPNCEVIRMLHPGLEGIELLEAKPLQGIFALAERARQPRIHIYKFENDKDVLVAELKGAAENRFRAIRFNDDDYLLALTGVPELCISVWRWATAEQIMVVNCLEKGFESDLLISPQNGDIWLEWSQSYITFYELTVFSNDKTVIRSDVTLPRNEFSPDQPDPRYGSPFSIDIVSVTFDSSGTVFVLDHLNSFYTINAEEKVFVSIGTLDLSHEPHDVKIACIIPYAKCIGALLNSGVFLILFVDDDEIKVKGRLDFTSRIRKYIRNPFATNPNTSFYAITDVEKHVECVIDGKMRTHYVVLDLTLSEIQSICFIERNAEYLGAVTEKGEIIILDVDTGNIFKKWKLPLYAEAISSHPLLPMVAIGTADGCVVYCDVRDINNPIVVHRSFLCEDTEIDKLAWTCRGRYMIAGDSQRRHLFLTYGLPSMEFHYLDYSSLPGLIRAINTPASCKDKRLQVVLQETESDEVPFQINNYRLDGESLDLVASQLLEAPIKTFCFSSYKKLMYSYTCENHCVGMCFFTEDMHAGGLLEPDIRFEGDLPLHVNRMLLVGDRLYTFGEDGYAMQHLSPAPKATALQTEEVLQTHFPSYDGIRDAIISMNGCHLVTIGYDNTIVHVQLKHESDMLNWALLGYGLDMDRVIDVQMRYFDATDIQKKIQIGDDEIDLYMQSVNDEKLYQTRRNEVVVKSVKDGLAIISHKVQELIQLNFTRDLAEQLMMEEFELDDDIEEIEAKECEKDKQIAEIMITTLIEERNKWAQRMKQIMWDDFEVKICKINGFNIDQEVSNYPLRPSDQAHLTVLEVLKHERRIEKKLLIVDSELYRARNEAINRVIKMVKKRRVKKRNIDLSKYPPHLRDEMRKLLKEMPPESDSSESEESVVAEDLFRRLTQTSIVRRSEENLIQEEEEEEEKEIEDEEVELINEMHDEEEEEEDEEVDEEEEEIEDEEEEQRRKADKVYKGDEEEDGIMDFELSVDELMKFMKEDDDATEEELETVEEEIPEQEEEEEEEEVEIEDEEEWIAEQEAPELYTSPTSEKPRTSLATSEKPRTSLATSEKPRTATPPSEKPRTSLPTSEKPKTSLPTSEKPGTSLPTSDKPQTSLPISEKPRTSLPTSDKPQTSLPISEKPRASLPTSEKPRTSLPTSEKPRTSLPTSEKPRTSLVTAGTERRSVTKEPEAAVHVEHADEIAGEVVYDGEWLETMEEEEKYDLFLSPISKSLTSLPSSGSGHGEEEEEDAEHEEEPSDDSEDDEEYEEDMIPLEFDVLLPEVYFVRRRKPRKKRRMALRKVNDEEDDDTKVWVEEDDSSDQSESDMERQIHREEEREERLKGKLSPEEFEQKKMLHSLYSGSLTYEFFDPNSLLYDQLDLAALHEIQSQIRVITNEIRKLKTDFNETFEELKAAKAIEVEEIIKRNTRIRNIAEFFDITVEVKDPEPTVFEQPETIFEVKDSEIPVEKTLSEEEKQLILAAEEEAARLEAEELETFHKKTVFQQGLHLDDLPPQRREDLLKIDIPKPRFMVFKEEWKWSAEEMEKAAEYYKEVEILERERAENRKEQETELRSLLKANADSKNQFDARLKKLQESRMMHELSIRMEEVKLCRMIRHIMRRFQIEAEEDRLSNLLKKLQTAIKTTHRLASDLASRVDNCTIEYNAVTETERLLERTFRMDLGEVGYSYDTFAKMYRKRPKLNFKADKTGELMRIVIRALAAQSLRLHNNDSEGQHAVEAIHELDDPMQTPVGCPRSTWDRFCRLRHEKIICEYEAKLISDELTVLHKVLNTFKGREAEGQQSIAGVLSEISRQRDLRLGHTHNVEFQMVVRDGQIELPQALVRRDFYNALLIQKYLVEICNVQIRKYESLKLGGLERAKVQHRAVKQIEWRFKKVQLEEKHAQEKLRDINTLRITKEVVKFLQTYDDFKAKEQRRLESVRKLQDGFKKFHDRVMSQKGSAWKRLRASAKSMVRDSQQKEELVLQKNLDVSDRRMLCNVGDRVDDIRSHRERLLVIMRSAFFMRLIAKNAEEIHCLEQELDRLYSKTFPLL